MLLGSEGVKRTGRAMPGAVPLAGIVAALPALLFAVFLLQGGGASASERASFRWLCHPSIPAGRNPCLTSLRTSVEGPDGRIRQFTPKRPDRPGVDCFYVYPTVSGQTTTFADLSIDPAVRGVAIQQAARFSPFCRVFAPVYRQRTISGLLAGTGSESGWDEAYAGVRDAFQRYLNNSNRGRGIVLIGHSQGTRHLSELAATTFDVRPSLRRKLVSALLIGGNFNVETGRTKGGTLDNIPTCSSPLQPGCVVAYSGYLAAPPVNGLFGRVTGALSPGGDISNLSVACVNPADLDGSAGRLTTLYNTARLDSVYGALLPSFEKPSAPWVSYPDIYQASCRSEGDFTWLQVDDVSEGGDGRFRIQEPLGRTWGTHLTEVNDAAGNLVKIVARQAKTWLARNGKPKERDR